ncbi:MAG: serine hydrolase [Chlorobi bacterium]|nr:serine hydrolase [Chlorobiota bacterium]
MKNKLSLIAFFILLSISAAVFAQTKPERLDELMNKYSDYGLFNGVVLVAEKGEIIYQKGFGFADYEWDVSNSPETKFRIGSISKNFTAAVIMKLVEEGKIKLDGKLSDYLPYYRKETGEKVTIRQLLNHTSGIPSYTSLPGVWSDSLRNHYDKKYFIEHFHSGDLEFEPGTQFKYDNTGYYLLAAIIEEVTGKSFEEVLQEKILTPAGLTNTGVETEEEYPIKHEAYGYMKGVSKLRRDSYIFMPNAMGAGSMYSTVGDLFKWDRVLYTDKILSAESKKKMFTPYLANYGFGWMIVSIPLPGGDSVKVITHSGGINGFNTVMTRFPDDDNFIAVFSNVSPPPIKEILRNLMAILYDKEFEYPKKPIKDYLLEIINEEGADAAVSLYKNLKKEETETFDFSENELNLLGYELLNENRLEDAVKIFALNVEEYPKSSNVYDSYAEALMKKGENEKAVENYKKSLDLNPANKNAIERLKKLGVEYQNEKLEVSAEILKSYEGVYALAPNFNVTIRADGTALFAKATGQGEYEIFPKSETKFFYKVVDAQIEFFKDENGKVDRLVLYQNGRELPGKKVE